LHSTTGRESVENAQQLEERLLLYGVADVVERAADPRAKQPRTADDGNRD
jgi:hypothetical protein